MMKRIIKLLLLFLWSFLIFYFSSRNGQTSTEQSDFFVLPLMRLLNFNNYLLVVFLIRKLAHIFIYFVLFVLFYWNIIEYNFKHNFIYTIIFCFLFALSDEFHQIFINERSGQLSDVLIDSFGFLLGYTVLLQFKRKNK